MKNILFVLGLSIILISCNKDNPDNPDITNPTPTSCLANHMSHTIAKVDTGYQQNSFILTLDVKNNSNTAYNPIATDPNKRSKLIHATVLIHALKTNAEYSNYVVLPKGLLANSNTLMDLPVNYKHDEGIKEIEVKFSCE